MIPIIHLRRIAIFGMLVLSIMACSNDDDAGEGGPIINPPIANTIVDIVEDNPEYSSFHSALELTGLDETLDDDSQDFTVFVPENEAFANFLSEQGFENIDEVPVEFLTQIVRNHILHGEFLIIDIAAESRFTSMALSSTGNSLSMFFKVTGEVVINGNSKVVTQNIEADNGLIHTVDAVINLPDITTFLMADPDFEMFVEAITRENGFDYLELLQSQDEYTPITLFAPTNEAFEAILEELDMVSIEEIPQNDLEAILKYHIVPESNFNDYPEILTTLETGEISMYYDWDAYMWKDANNREGYVNRGFIATNGNIYKVDKVMLPELDEDPDLQNIATLFWEDPDFEKLIEAFSRQEEIDYWELLTSQDNLAPITFFAPTNEAFEALFEELEIESLEDIPQADLEAILKYHLVPTTNFNVNNLTADRILTTLESGELLIRYDPIDQNYWVDESSRVDYLYSGIKASNGYLYKLDKVLLPEL